MFQSAFNAVLCVRKGIKTSYGEQAKTEGEVGRLIRESEAR